MSIVFADLVGSTARAESLDPEDVRALLSTYHSRVRQELAAHGGTVEKFIGDAVVAVFGAPSSHEDDPERAVRAALAIQDAIAELNEAQPALELEVRIGVNTGEALVALEARPASGEGMVSGDVINTAARLQSAAPPGGVLVGEQTYRSTLRGIDYADHEPVSAKGKADPVAAWLAVGRRSSYGMEDIAVGRAPLVGREREVALLADALARVRRDERPQLITLVGVPGIGKSRLVHELREIVDSTPDLITWRRGRSLSYGEGVAYWALGEIVKAQAGILESDDADVASSKLTRVVTDLFSDRTEAAWLERQLRPLVGLPGGEGRPSRDEAFTGWRRLLEALAEERPTVLVFEDLHWADDDLLDFVDQLVDEIDAVPLLLVCTARPELLSRRPDWGGGKLNALTLSLSPLSDDETALLLASLLERRVLPAESQAKLIERAAGVPLFAEEYVRMLESGNAGDDLPETLQGLVAARIDGLPAAAKELLQDAAVLGKVFWSDALRDLSSLAGSELDEQLRLLERQEFVRRERRTAVRGARQYVFLHAIAREAAYGQIPRAARSLKHRRTAEWITSLPSDRSEDRAEVLAHHLASAIEYGAAAGLPVDDLRPAAAEALQKAGDRVWELAAPREAARFYRAALAAGTVGEPSPHLLFALGRSLVYAENAGEDVLEQAVEGLLAAGDAPTAAEALVALHEAKWLAGTTSTALLERACELIGDTVDTRAAVYVHGSLGRFYGLSGRSAEALPLDDSAMAGAEHIGDHGLYAWALNNRGVARWHLGDPEYLADLEHALEISLEIGSSDVGRSRINLGSILDDYGNLDAAHEHLSEGLAFAHRVGSSRWTRIVSVELAVNRFLAGRWEEAVDLAATLVDEVRGGYLEAEAKGVLVLAAAERGQPVDAEDVARVSERAREIGDLQVLVPWLACAARALATSGDAAGAAAYLDELLDGCRGPAAAYVQGTWFYDAAVAAAILGRSAELREVAHRQGGTRWNEAAVALLSGKPQLAAELLAAMGAFDEAGARLAVAEALVETGRQEEAIGHAERALVIYRSLGAEPGMARAEAIKDVPATESRSA